MLRSTPSSHPDYPPLEEAIKIVKSLADYINEHKHDADNVTELCDIQSKFKGENKLGKNTQISDFPGDLALTPKRKFIKDGQMSVNKVRAFVFHEY